MILLQADSLKLSFGDREILKNVSIRIPERGRIALSGANGSGKSTLLTILAGLRQSEGGNVSSHKAVRISYLPQSGIEHRGRSLEDELETAFSHFKEDEARLEELGRRLEHHSSEGPETRKLLEEHHQISERIASSHYYQREQYIMRTIRGLGFKTDDLHRDCGNFSGGWQMRIALAKIILENPDVMLLDEPTNYLDLDARQWLADEMNRFHGGILMVSHDKGFLDDTVNQVAELFMGQIKLYKGNYSHYERLREQEMEILIKQYEQQQQEIQQLEDFIARFRANASKAAQVQSRIKQLNKIERIEIPESMKRMHLHFPQAPRSGDMVLEADNIEKSYGDLHIYRNLSLELQRGDRAVLIGPNGVGKSTLLRILAGRDRNYQGTIRYGSKVEMAYFAQESEDELNTSWTIMEEMEAASPTELYPNLRGMLGAFLFRGDDIYKPISVLSGGEKNRLALLKMLMRPGNFLILDEPTNHLDLTSKEVLLDALKDYEGTILFVSHDRFFIRELATRVIELQLPEAEGDYRQVHNIPGNFDYYLEYRSKFGSGSHSGNHGSGPAAGAAASAADSSASASASSSSSSVYHPGASSGNHPGPQEAGDGTGKLSHEEMKKRRSLLKKLQRREEEVLSSIEEGDEKQAEIQHQMSLEENYSDGEKISALQNSLDSLEQKQQELHLEWEDLALRLEELKKP
ncbi:ABC-F family ATP-binding cassette domain-containing protein [Salinispira pacifica]|uniref:ABC transporter ATP-binding protein n=1 Tax=Salinispira pacifica TaxID=1307761 RepID=V5WIG4_9SPIO|nr:ABC-F family ATP-binding cassette domain-containing protein [Salinispira pacifica]AHC15568.1 ABC transporter ATP-binding protein [Salinispira pacifica]